jgi:hypothetical protein
MDVLELPRPVINFLRTMSKEMNRYSLCWDIYGGSESVTLTLTWKITEQQQQQVTEKEVHISANGSIDSKKQLQKPPLIKTKNINNENDQHQSRHSRETNDIENHQRGKSADNNKKIQKSSTLANDYSPIRLPQLQQQTSIVKNDSPLKTAFNGSLTALSKQQCPPPSLAYIKRKSIDQKSVFIKQLSAKETPQNYYYSTQISNSSDDPWIKRNNHNNNNSSNDFQTNEQDKEENDNNSKIITAVVTKLDSNNNNSDNNERKLSLQPSDSFSIPNNLSTSNQIKVKFDPTLHYI